MKNKDFGLDKEDLEIIINVLKKFEEVNEAIIFGSRVLGNFKRGSDIDLALKGDVEKIYLSIKSILNEETLIPYHFDIYSYNNIHNHKLKEYIDTFGKVIYRLEKYGSGSGNLSRDYKKLIKEKLQKKYYH